MKKPAGLFRYFFAGQPRNLPSHFGVKCAF
jgi:hypothetical protein